MRQQLLLLVRDVSWDLADDGKTLIVKRGNREVVLNINSASMEVNSKSVPLAAGANVC